jgi:hypothetical protein
MISARSTYDLGELLHRTAGTPLQTDELGGGRTVSLAEGAEGGWICGGTARAVATYASTSPLASDRGETHSRYLRDEISDDGGHRPPSDRYQQRATFLIWQVQRRRKAKGGRGLVCRMGMGF